MESEKEKKSLLESVIDSVQEAIDKAVESVKDFWDNLLGKKKEEGAEGEEKTGIAKIIDDIAKWNKDLWDKIVGREGEEGEGKGGFDLGKTIRDIRNRVRDFLGMEPLPEEEPKP